jgi:tetratricopeptide (TPR) repeat protein
MNTSKNIPFVCTRVHSWLILLLLLPSCARNAAPPGTGRLAILRFENLDANPAMDWMGRGFSEVISTELEAAPDVLLVSPTRLFSDVIALGTRPISAPGISVEKTAALAAGAEKIAYGTYWVFAGRLEARLTVQDTARLNRTRVIAASAPAGDLLGAARSLALQLSPHAAQYGTDNEDAVKDYVMALEAQQASDLAAAATDAGLAIAADANFGPPYRLLAGVKAQQDRSGALGVIERALAQPGIAPLERARLEIDSARLHNDPAALQQALVTFAKLQPADTDSWRSLADLAFRRRDFGQAVDAWRKVLALEPDNLTALNQLGYAAIYSHDLPAATAALNRYATLRPKDPNPIDSLGDINLITGHLYEAESYYVQAANRDPNFYAGGDWYKAAVARLLAGDAAGADKFASRFAAARAAAHDPGAPLITPQWQWLSGDTKPATGALLQMARAAEADGSRELASRAYSQLAVWSLLAGDRTAATAQAEKAAMLAVPRTATETAIVRFLALPPASASEWQARTERLAPNPAQQAIRDTMLAYALLLSGQFAPAAEHFNRLYDQGAAETNEGIPVLLAWCYTEAGRPNQVAPLLEFNPVPSVNGPSIFTSFYFPRLLKRKL